MKKNLLILAFALILSACSNQAKPTETTAETAVESVSETATETVEETTETAAESVEETATETVAETTGELVLTLDKLAKFNGKDGQKAYVAVQGKIYDVTDVPQWANGEHNGVQAGTDATEAITGAPHGEKVLENLPVVGRLAE